MFKNLVIIALVLFLAGCATLYNPATGRDEFIFINSATEVAIGKSAVAQMTEKHTISKDRNLQLRIERVGRQIARVSDRGDIEYKFFVLEEEDLNALTLPGGFIYVNEGLMNILDDDELAFVLAHEIGHTAARHIAKKIQANMAYQLLLAVAFASSGQTDDSATEIATGVDMVYDLIGLSYSRKDEYEADRLGLKYAFKADFNPDACLSALEKIKKEGGPNWRLLEYFRTHPYVDDRIDRLKAIIPELNVE